MGEIPWGQLRFAFIHVRMITAWNGFHHGRTETFP